MPEYAHKPIHSGLKTHSLNHCVVAKIAAASIYNDEPFMLLLFPSIPCATEKRTILNLTNAGSSK